MKKEFINYYLPNILFNLFEIIIIFLLGICFNVKLEHILAIFIMFIINKLIFGKSMHYKDWRLCLIWSILLFLSYYLLSKIDIKIALLGTFTFIFFTQKANIKDLKNLFFWAGNDLNKRVYDWVIYNLDNKYLIEYKKNLEKNDKRKYYIYKYRFEEFKTYKEIADLMGLEQQIINDEIKIMSHYIEYGIRLKER